MAFVVAALCVFLALFILDRIYKLPDAARAVVAGVEGVAVYAALQDGWDSVGAFAGVAAGALGVILSDLVSMLQAATDSLRVRVLSAATRRGRIPPI